MLNVVVAGLVPLMAIGETGLNVAVAPVGSPEADTEIDAVYVGSGISVIWLLVICPAVMVAGAVAPIWKSVMLAGGCATCATTEPPFALTTPDTPVSCGLITGMVGVKSTSTTPIAATASDEIEQVSEFCPTSPPHEPV